MGKAEAGMKRIYAQSWKCRLCDRKLFSFEAIPTVSSPKQECLCARCFVKDNPELAKKIVKIAGREKEDKRSLAKNRRGAIIWMAGVLIVFILFLLKNEGVI